MMKETQLKIKEYRNILDALVTKCKEVFGVSGKRLTGVYLHGSMAMGCFNPDKSDIDLIVVVDGRITDRQKLSFMEEVVRLNKLAPAKGLEISVVQKAYCRDFVYPTPYELHFSPMYAEFFERAPMEYIQKMQGTDKDLAAHFTVINHYGIALYGASVKQVFCGVPVEAYMDSLWYDIGNAGQEIQENPIYVALNLCRVLAFCQEGRVLSKYQGGEWGVKYLPPEYGRIVAKAVRCYVSDEEMKVDEKEGQEFCKYMLNAIKADSRGRTAHPAETLANSALRVKPIV